jgi:hypothetical protein
MLKSACAALALLAAAPAAAPAAAQPAAQPASTARAPARLSVDTPIRDLIADPRTRAVLVKTMPGFVERMEAEPEVAQMFGGVSIADMVADPHVKGLTPEVLAKLDALLAKAQTPAP